jgi:hypothetical protein
VVNIEVSRSVKQFTVQANAPPARQVTISASRTAKQVTVTASRTIQEVTISAVRTPARQVNIEVLKIAGPPGKDFEPADFLPERLTGVIDGVNRIFSTSVPFETSTIVVFLNGLKEKHFSVLSDTQIMLDEPAQNSGFTDCIEAFYIRKQI